MGKATDDALDAALDAALARGATFEELEEVAAGPRAQL